MENIRNFCIIAHIDHGKSTLADRFLEITETVEKRNMRAQYLDQLELERERGITIKMAPVRMSYTLNTKFYILNLIDTPGHSDFSYEVSRALAAVEGAILLVDATQGIQAQTLANLRSAEGAGLKLIGAINKIDLFQGREGELRPLGEELAALLRVPASEICLVSGKTGEGVKKLLEAVIEKIPYPRCLAPELLNIGRGLIFDSFYDDHKGVIASVRVFDGEIAQGDTIRMVVGETDAKIKELGIFTPRMKSVAMLHAGEIGYVATGIKDPARIRIGDTLIVQNSKLDPRLNREPNSKFLLPGYREPQPVVFVSFYPEDADEHETLSRNLQKLKLNDSALTIEPDQNEVLGRGFKIGFLGRLHYEITAERLRREFGTEMVNTFPSVAYRVRVKSKEQRTKNKERRANNREQTIDDKWQTVTKPEDLPAEFEEIQEPMVRVEILVPSQFLNALFPLFADFRMKNVETETLKQSVIVRARMPLAELIGDFDDVLKSRTEGYASFSYERAGYDPADVVKVEFLVAGEIVPGLSRFFHRSVYEREGRKTVLRLKELLPRAQVPQAIQARANGRIIAREDIPALKKDVTGYLYGGDRTRKMKLWKKQKRGKKKLKERTSIRVSADVFRKLMQRS